MSMAQDGVQRQIDLKETGSISTGGIEKVDTLTKEETLMFGVGKQQSETVSRAETVIITNL